MLGDFSVKNMLNSIIPISRFNKGEANKIFDEVSQSGYKIVVKNNSPTCVLLTPKKYEELMEIVENYYLLAEANNLRYKDYYGSAKYSAEDDCFFGKLIGINALITFEGKSIDELKKAFRDAVDNYVLKIV